MAYFNSLPDNDVYSDDPIEYVAAVFNRLLAEPMGLGLALFLAILFTVPSQIPDMVDPYFQGDGLGWAAFFYTLLAIWMGYTVWFWMVAAIRSEALIPGGRYYMPYGARERGYVKIFGSWYRPFNYAANFAGLLAFLACMSRPIFLTLDWSTGSTIGFIATMPVIWLGWSLLYYVAFGNPSQKLVNYSVFIVAPVYFFGFLIFGLGTLTMLIIAVTAVIGAFALVAIFDKREAKQNRETGAKQSDSGTPINGTDFVLSFKRRDLSNVSRFSWLWSLRATSILLASPHRITRLKGDTGGKRIARALMWCLHVFGPAIFLVILFFHEKADQFIPLPTPVAALLSLSMSVGPLVIFLSLLRDILEHFMIFFVRKGKRERLIDKHRHEMVEMFPEDPKKHPLENDPGIERLAYGAYRSDRLVDGSKRMNAGTRIFARAAALILMGMLFFSNIFDNLHARIENRPGDYDMAVEDYTPSKLSYHISGARAEDAIGDVHARDDLAGALVAWKKARPDLVQHEATVCAAPPCPEVPVVVVSAYGGANRAAVWSMAMLQALNGPEASGPLNRHIFAFSGVSGGSLGSVTYAFHIDRVLDDTAEQVAWPLPKAATHDLLAPTISYFFNVDLLKRFDVGPLRLALSDRNEILERTFEKWWQAEWKLDHMQKTGLLAAHQASDGRMPHLLLNGVDSRSGRRVLTSTLDVQETMFPDTQDFFLRFGRDIRPATAVMNSARFPLISPAGRYLAHLKKCEVQEEGKICPLQMRHQIIDGGYYENSGVQTAFELARAIDGIADAFAQEHGWKPVPVIVAISNQALGIVPSMAGADQLKRLDMDGYAVFEGAGENFQPHFRDVTPTCGQKDPIPEMLVADADEFSIEIAAILRGVVRTGASHNHRSLRVAMAAYCGSDGAAQLRNMHRFLHFGLPQPVSASQSAPMNWVLSKNAVKYLTSEAPKAVIDAQADNVAALRAILGSSER